MQQSRGERRELDRLRTGWLNPPEWTREEVLEFYSRRLGQRPVGTPHATELASVVQRLLR